MLYSGADLIRTSGQQQGRMQKLAELDKTHSVQAVSNIKESSAQLGEDTKGALLRFAKFVTGDKGKKKGKPTPAPESKKARLTKVQNPYLPYLERYQSANSVGQTIDIFA